MSELIDRQALKAAHGLGTDCADCKQDARSCQYDRYFSMMDFCEWIDDAPTAIDALEAIVAECDSQYVSRRYLKEKAEKARWCVGYISEVVQK